MLKLCEFLEIEEGREFIIDGYVGVYRIMNNIIEESQKPTYKWKEAINFPVNDLVNCKIYKLPKKKQFTDDELAIMKNIPIEYEWMVRDRDNSFTLFKDKPVKSNSGNYWHRYAGDVYVLSFDVFGHLFKSITIEDKEPVFIDDYVKR